MVGNSVLRSPGQPGFFGQFALWRGQDPVDVTAGFMNSSGLAVVSHTSNPGNVTRITYTPGTLPIAWVSPLYVTPGFTRPIPHP